MFLAMMMAGTEPDLIRSALSFLGWMKFMLLIRVAYLAIRCLFDPGNEFKLQAFVSLVVCAFWVLLPVVAILALQL